MNLKGASSNPRVTSSNPRVTNSNPQVTSLNQQVTSSNPQVQESFNQLKLMQTVLKFSHVLRSKVLNRNRKFLTQLLRSVSGDNPVFYFSTISWLQLQQETKWVSTNFQRRYLTSAQKSHFFFDDFGETFTLNLIKQNAAHFSFLFLTKTFLMCPWKTEI